MSILANMRSTTIGTLYYRYAPTVSQSPSTTVVDCLELLLHAFCSDSTGRCCGALYATVASAESAQNFAQFETPNDLKIAAFLVNSQVVKAKFALELEQTACVRVPLFDLDIRGRHHGKKSVSQQT